MNIFLIDIFHLVNIGYVSQYDLILFLNSRKSSSKLQYNRFNHTSRILKKNPFHELFFSLSQYQSNIKFQINDFI